MASNNNEIPTNTITNKIVVSILKIFAANLLIKTQYQ